MIKVFINKLNRLCNLFFGLASWVAMEYVFCEALPWKFMKNMLQTFADHWHTARRSYSTHSWIFAIFTWDKCSVKLIFSVLLTNRTVSNLLFFLGEEHVTRGLQCCTAAIKKPRLESSFYHPDEQDECKYAGGWYEVFHYKGGIHSFNLCTKDFRLYIYISFQIVFWGNHFS